MKKALFSLSMAFIAITSWGQIEVTESGEYFQINKMQSEKSKVAAINDTILPPFACANPISYLSSGGTIITSALQLDTASWISDVGQLLNLSGDTIEVHGLIALVIEKEEGPNKGSFTASVHDTVGGINTTPMATSSPVSFDNIQDTSDATIMNYFPFPNPVRVEAPFWASVDVSNGSDTISLASTPNQCGALAIFSINNAGWYYYSSVFTVSSSPLQMSAHIWAAVDSLPQASGLDRNFISMGGLKFYPNPATDVATIEFNLPGENEVSLLVQDMTGREVYRTTKSFNGGDRAFSLDLSGFENGAYTYQVVGKKGQLNGVFLKK